MAVAYGEENRYDRYGQPTLDLVFTGPKKSLTDRVGNKTVEFTRSSNATYFGSDGLIKTAATNEARFDHDPATGESLGLLVEEERTNSFTYSEEFDNVAWSKTNVTITANAVVAPDGNTTAELLSSSAAGTATINRAFTRNNPAFSVFIKAGSSSTANIKIQSDVVGRNVSYNVDLSTGVLTAGTGNTGNLTGWTEYTSITAVGNGWYRVFIGFLSSTITVNSTYSVSPSLNNTAAAAGESIYIWGAQLEAGSFPTSYIPTTSSTVTRGADVASISNAEMQNCISSTGVTCVMKTIWETWGANQEIHFSDGAGNLSVSQWRQNTLRWSGVVSTTNYVYTSNLVTVFAARDTTTAVIGNDQGAYAEAAATLSPGAGDFQFGKFTNSQRKHHILRIMYYPTRLTQSQLQALTL